jgi:hypothetical protein
MFQTYSSPCIANNTTEHVFYFNVYTMIVSKPLSDHDITYFVFLCTNNHSIALYKTNIYLYIKQTILLEQHAIYSHVTINSDVYMPRVPVSLPTSEATTLLPHFHLLMAYFYYVSHLKIAHHLSN